MTRWITDYLGTAAWDEAQQPPDTRIIDVRELVDRAGNFPDIAARKIDEAVACLGREQKVIICCDYGMSRSNAIAAGVLARREGIRLNEAVRRVLDATGESAIQIDVLATVRRAIGEEDSLAADRSDRRFLVTGATGFVGTAFMPQLAELGTVIAPGKAELNLMRDTVVLDLLVKENAVDTIIHLASPRVYTTNESLGTCVVMLKNVLDVCRQNQTELVYVSSWEVFSGYRSAGLRANESLIPNPGGTYGLGKVFCEELIEHYRTRYGLARTILRSSPVYGIGSERPRFIWTFIEKALRGEDIFTHRYTNGEPELDLLHIDDLCSALRAAVERRPGAILHVGSGVGISTAEVARKVVRRIGSASRVEQSLIDRDVGNIVMDTRRARDVLGWRPMIDFDQGLENIIRAASNQQHGQG